jgi:hypothetical protein
MERAWKKLNGTSIQIPHDEHSAASSRNQIKEGGLSLWHNSGLKSGNEARNHLSSCHDRPWKHF